MKASKFCLSLLLVLGVTGTPHGRDAIRYTRGQDDAEIGAITETPHLKNDDSSGSAVQHPDTKQTSQGDSRDTSRFERTHLGVPPESYPLDEEQPNQEEPATSRGRSSGTLQKYGRDREQGGEFEGQRRPAPQISTGMGEDSDSDDYEQPKLPGNVGMEKQEKRGVSLRTPSGDRGSVRNGETAGSGRGRHISIGRGGGGRQSDDYDRRAQFRGLYSEDQGRRLGARSQHELQYNLLGARWLLNRTRTWTRPTLPTRPVRHWTTN